VAKQYEQEPADWEDCFSIEAWIRQWVEEDSEEEDTLAEFLDNSEKKEAFDYLEELVGNYWRELNGHEKNRVWFCALTCRNAQLNAIAASSATMSTMSASPSIRW
jgi:hypothetical protein